MKYPRINEMKNLDHMDALALLESAAELFDEVYDFVCDDQQEAIRSWLSALTDDDEE